MSKSTAQVLREAADLIEPEGAWTQGEDARDARGLEENPLSSGAVCWCMAGAIIAKQEDPTSSAIIESVADDLGVAFLYEFNDSATQAEVVAALRAAADRAEASE